MIALLEPKPATTPKRSTPRSVEELKRTVSGTRLSTWLQCRLKFYFRYVAAIPKPTSEALHFGSMIHAALRDWNLARWRGKRMLGSMPDAGQPFDPTALREIFDAAWINQEAIEWEDEESTKQLAWNLLEMYFQQTPIRNDEKPEGVEVSVEADLSAHGLPTLIGIIDLVRAGGRIVDFKTSAATPNSERVAHLHETQTTAYAVLYRESTGQKESAIELHHLVKLKKPKLVVTVLDPITESQQTRFFHLIESYIAGLDREDFVPSPGLQCACCEFFNECRAWH